MLIANAQQIRQADQLMIETYAYPGIVLMENAARAATEKICTLYPQQTHFLILVGPGNNGGDGLAIARMLYIFGKEVTIVSSHAKEKYRGDALINWEICESLTLPIPLFQPDGLDDMLATRPILIDALLGTGIKGKLRSPVKEIIDFFYPFALQTIAIDLPSGLDASTGAQENKVLTATHTLTFQLPKICHHISPASESCGQIHVLDIGIWPMILDQLGIRRHLLTCHFIQQHYRNRLQASHKGNFGHVLIVGGSKRMAGAVALAALAAVRSGAGLCTVLTVEAARTVVLAHCPEAMCVAIEENYLGEKATELYKTLVGDKDVVLVGPGMGTESESAAFLKEVISSTQAPLVLDADALNIISKEMSLLNQLPPGSVLTPHPGEMSRLAAFPDPKINRLEAAEQFAQQHTLTLVLKGKGSLVATPTVSTYINTSGNPGLASGGTGDVLAGIITSLIGQAYESHIAAAMAVFLHGKAADWEAAKRGEEGLIASDVASYFGLALMKCLDSRS